MKYCEEFFNDLSKVVKEIPGIEDLRGKRIFLTGASGLIGSCVADILLYLNCSVGFKMQLIFSGRSRLRLEERFSHYSLGKDYEFYEYDALSGSAPNVIADYIIHCAGNSSPQTYASNPVETLLVNVTGVHAILRCALNAHSMRVLYVSSSEVYGKKTNNDMYIESDYGFVDILNTRACYPNGKRAAETLCAAFSDEYGVDTVIVRPGHIYGPMVIYSDNRASAQFTRNAIAHEDIVMKSAGLQLRSYCYSLDCASAILAVLIRGESKNAYNISNSNSVVTIRDVAEKFAQFAGCQVVFENPDDFEKKGYSFMDCSALNSEKIESLGWKAVFDLHEGIACTLRYYDDAH